MKKVIISIVVLLVITVAIVSTNSKPEENANGKPTIKIGVTLGMTGNLGRLGQSNKEAVLMAQEDVSLMNTKYNYEFIIEDDAFDNKRLTQIMNKFINLDKTPAVVSTYSKAHKIAKVYGDKGDIINMGCSWSDTIGEGKYNFNGYTSTRISVKRIMQHLIDNGVENVGILSTSSPGAIDMLGIWNEEVELAGLKLVYDERFLLGNNDFTLTVGKMKQQDIDIMFLDIYTHEMDLLFKEMRIQGVDMPITTIDHFPFVSDLDFIEGNWFVSYLMPEGGFYKKYESRTDIPMQICVPQTYDNIMLLVDAFENASSTEISDVADYINNIKEYESVSGTIEITDTNFNQKESTFAIIKDGKVEVLK